MHSRPTAAQLVSALRQTPFFETLDETLLAALAATAVWRTLDAGEALFWEGETAVGLYFLQSGWLKAVRSAPSGREQVIKFMGPGELFNEVGALAAQVNPATAVALEPAGVWLIPRDAVWTLIDAEPRLARYLIAQLAGRLLHLVDLVTDLSLRSVRQRLARLLLEAADGAALHRPRWYTQAELAARLGTVPDVVQRALRSLENDGLIRVDRQQIDILDREKLANG